MTTEQPRVRRHERARLAGVLDRLQAGASGALQLVGEAGIGKSFLLGELVREAHDRGVLVLVGRAAAGGRTSASPAAYTRTDEFPGTLATLRQQMRDHGHDPETLAV